MNYSMKTIFKIIISLILVVFTASMFVSCNNDDSGSPAITYIRVTDPEASDSLLTSAYLGDLIVIMGENLDKVRNIIFNDQEAVLNPAYVTSNSIMVNVPSTIPGVVTNILKLIFADGTIMEYPFNIVIPAPLLSNLVCEYVPDGGNAVIQGNYFIDDPGTPLQVLFPGDIQGEIVSFTLNELVVKVPVGVDPGPMKVKSIYGSTQSKFYFRDNRNIILDWDNLTAAGGWRSGDLSSTAVPQLTGLYVTFTGTAAAGAGGNFPWNEDGLSFNLWGEKNGRPEVPFYSGDISKACIKFEIWVVEPWQSYAMQMIFTPWATKDNNSYIANDSWPRGVWKPWQATGTYKNEGWTTVSVPLSEFVYKKDGTICYTQFSTDYLGGLTFMLYHGGVEGVACTLKMCIDNIRIVPL
jgi:hypothetical protein